ncbi:P2Y purinoceptor 2-like [Gadus macrocephalus]|uniref:P2Y purinoceptor 2-like n=1 Tax=Gadus macrocephalus TaxID=80720 RepID=UPI0028CB540C|nr:P2Y purinoceptor 2-like [Gadus macrocephalus]
MDSSNMSNATYENDLGPCYFDQDINKFIQYVLPVIYSLLFFFGLSLNAMVLFFITFRTKHWTPSTIYMLNLTLCDILYVFTLPFFIYNWVNNWPFGEAFCKICRFLFEANHYGSIVFLAAISLHRFIGICYPVRSLSWNSNRRAKLVSVGVWACVLTGQAPVLHFGGIGENDNSSYCYVLTNQTLSGAFLVYSSVISVVMFVLPFMLVMVCYGLMVRKLLEPSWVSGEGQQGLRAAHRTKQKSVKMIIIVLMTFVFCFLPYHLIEFWRRLILDDSEEMTCKMWGQFFIALQVTWLMASANSIMDPILYFMAGQDFRKNMMKKRNKSENTLPECANTVLTASL